MSTNDGKRRLSSDGKTPKPSTKTVKMASLPGNRSGKVTDTSSKGNLVDQLTDHNNLTTKMMRHRTDPDPPNSSNWTFKCRRMDTIEM
jgi:hypothetical protein